MPERRRQQGFQVGWPRLNRRAGVHPRTSGRPSSPLPTLVPETRSLAAGSPAVMPFSRLRSPPPTGEYRVEELSAGVPLGGREMERQVDCGQADEEPSRGTRSTSCGPRSGWFT